MKILHIGKYYPPFFGGIETVTQLLAKGFAQLNHRVTVICFDAKCSNVEVIRNKSLVIYKFKQSFNFSSQPFGLKYINAIIKLRNKYDVVHIHYPNIVGGLCALFFTNSKIVIHWHSDVLKNPLVNKIVSIIEYLILSKADCIVATSKNYAKSSLSLRKFLHKVYVIPIGINDRSSAKNYKLESKKINNLLNSKFVLSVGRLVDYKGFDYLIKSFIDTPADLKLIIIGKGPLIAQLTELIDSNKLSDKVFILSDINSDALHLFYKNATLFCLPSITRAEAYGVVLVEALSYGLPIVATDVYGSGITFVNTNKITGFNVPPKDSHALALAITRIAKSERLLNYFSGNSRRIFLSTFTEDIFVQRFLNFYNQLYYK